MNSLMQIQKLEDSNNSSSSIEMKSVVIHCDLWHVVSGKTVKPAAATSQQALEYDATDEK
ncbi:unnamed protein product, partial [Ceratitis capitata]